MTNRGDRLNAQFEGINPEGREALATVTALSGVARFLGRQGDSAIELRDNAIRQAGMLVPMSAIAVAANLATDVIMAVLCD